MRVHSIAIGIISLISVFIGTIYHFRANIKKLGNQFLEPLSDFEHWFNGLPDFYKISITVFLILSFVYGLCFLYYKLELDG